MVTEIVNCGSEADDVPSLTVIVMPANVPTFAVVGVPVKAPVLALNVAQLGALLIENVSAPPEPVFAVGRNEYASPTVALVAGVPLMVGGTTAEVTVTLALADLVGSSVDTADTVTVAGDGTFGGEV